MNSVKPISVLNQLVRRHNRSLASYLCYASPTWHRDGGKAKATLDVISTQQKEIVDRAGEQVEQHKGVVDFGAYPMSYTGYHDLSFDYLLGQLITEQRTLVSELDECVARTKDEPRVHELVQEALGMAKGHLDSLQELREFPAEV